MWWMGHAPRIRCCTRATVSAIDAGTASVAVLLGWEVGAASVGQPMDGIERQERGFQLGIRAWLGVDWIRCLSGVVHTVRKTRTSSLPVSSSMA